MSVAFQPLVAGHHGGLEPRVMWDDPVTHRFAVPAPSGGWREVPTGVAATAQLEGSIGGGTPIALRSTSVSLYRQCHALRLPGNVTDTYSASGRVKFTRLRVQYRRPATDTLEAYLVATDVSNGQATAVDSWTDTAGDFTTSAGSFTASAFTVNHTLDPVNYAYTLMLLLGTASVGAGSVAVGMVQYDLQTAGLLGS